MAIERQSTPGLTIRELQAQIDAALPGAEIELGPGCLTGRLVISRPLVLRGTGAGVTVIDAHGQGTAIAIDAPEGEVRIEELTVRGGRSATGGGISVDNGAQVEVVGCLIEGCAAVGGRGGAVAIDRGRLRLIESTLVENQARIGGAIWIGGDAEAELSLSILARNRAQRGGALAITDGAGLTLWTCRLSKNVAEVEGHHLWARGSSSRRPRVTLENASLGWAPSAGLSIAQRGAELTTVATTVAREHLPSAFAG
jgi:hypothetical protein